jgi:IMP dehydrogenase
MHRLGGLGILHRYATTETVLGWIKEIRVAGGLAIPSIGIKPADFVAALCYMEAGATAINVDIAHGDSAHMLDMVTRLAVEGIDVIAGNVATKDGALRLAKAGAKVIKVGIGPGSLCTTRIVTGHGVPQLSAIEACTSVKYYFPDVSIIAYGGIRNSGDCVKALAFGADMVMVGSLLAGTSESPGVVILEQEGWVKEYRGMASRRARDSVTQTDASYTPEGESTFVKFKGPTESLIQQLIGGMRSGLSYSGVNNLADFRRFAQYVTITGNGMAESKPHLLTR